MPEGHIYFITEYVKETVTCDGVSHSIVVRPASVVILV